VPGDPTGLRDLLFGNCDLDNWPARESNTEPDAEPWRSFVRARNALRSGDPFLAETLWQDIADDPDMESRQVLQAWHFLRSIGVAPPPEIAKRVYGAIAEVAVDEGHDVLAAYADGSVRYLNVSGAAILIEDRIATVEVPAAEMLAIGQSIVNAIGPTDNPLPPLPNGHSRLTLLTPIGPHFGQGPDGALRADPRAGPFFDAATRTLVAVVALSPPDGWDPPGP